MPRRSQSARGRTIGRSQGNSRARTSADSNGAKHQLEPVWSQEPLNRRETYEAPRTLVGEIALVGQISLQRAVPGALRAASHPNEYELHLLRDGRMNLWIDSPRRLFEVQGGMASLTQPGQLHSGAADGLMLPGRWTWVQFRIPRDSRTAMPGLTLRQTIELRRALNAVNPPVFHYSPALEHCMERLLVEHRRPTPESPVVARAILHELIAWIIRDHRDGMLRKETEPRGYSPPIMKVLDWLRGNLDKNASVGDLADIAGLSESYFRGWFHRELGSSPSDYVTQMRIERAKQMLLVPKRSITDVAMELGYNTSAYFTAVFHRETGMTPTAFRAQAERDKQPADEGERPNAGDQPEPVGNSAGTPPGGAATEEH